MSENGDTRYNNANRAFLQAFMGRSTLTLEEAKPIMAAIFTVHGIILAYLGVYSRNLGTNCALQSSVKPFLKTSPKPILFNTSTPRTTLYPPMTLKSGARFTKLHANVAMPLLTRRATQ